MKKLFLAILFVIFFPSSTSAHPGMTDSYGGHYCETDCIRYGEVYGQWHYHGLPNTYYPLTTSTNGLVMSYETLHELMKKSDGYKKVKNGYKIFDVLICKDGFSKKEGKCEKPKAKKLKSSQASESLSSAVKNERVRFMNSMKKKRYVELEDLTDSKWKKFKKEILENVPKSEIERYAPSWFIEEVK
jgi:hypothetical protein